MLWPNGTTIIPIITSPYGPRDGRMHNGVDMIGLYPIRSIAAGRVVASGWNALVGWTINIRHADGSEARYCHLAVKSPLAVGSNVAEAERVGNMGETGSQAAGIHLHLDLYVNGVRIDPVPYIAARLPGSPAGGGSNPFEDDMSAEAERMIQELHSKFFNGTEQDYSTSLVDQLYGKTLDTNNKLSYPKDAQGKEALYGRPQVIEGLVRDVANGKILYSPDAGYYLGPALGNQGNAILAAVGQLGSTGAAPVDVQALADALREGLGDEIATTLANRILSTKE